MVRALIPEDNKKLMEDHQLTKRTPHEVNASLWNSDRDDEHEAQYREWGVPQVNITALREERRILEWMSSSLKKNRDALKEGRAKYLNDLKETVGLKAFEIYRVWEQNKPAYRTFEEFQKHRGHVPKDLLDQHKNTIVNLFRESNIALIRSWHAPYGDLPGPLVGLRMIGLAAQQDLVEFEEAVNAFNAAAKLHGIPDTLSDQLNIFFSLKWGQLQERITMSNGS
jgi:hypothetical protein